MQFSFVLLVVASCLLADTHGGSGDGWTTTSDGPAKNRCQAGLDKCKGYFERSGQYLDDMYDYRDCLWRLSCASWEDTQMRDEADATISDAIRVEEDRGDFDFPGGGGAGANTFVPSAAIMLCSCAAVVAQLVKPY